MATKDMRRCSTALVIWEMEIKSKMREFHTPIVMDKKIKKKQKTPKKPT